MQLVTLIVAGFFRFLPNVSAVTLIITQISSSFGVLFIDHIDNVTLFGHVSSVAYFLAWDFAV